MAVKFKKYVSPAAADLRLIKVTERNLQNVAAWFSDQKDVKSVEVIHRGARLDKRSKAVSYLRVHIEGVGIRVVHVDDFAGYGVLKGDNPRNPAVRWTTVIKAERFESQKLTLVK